MATVYVRVSPRQLTAYKAAATAAGARSLNAWAEAILDTAAQEAAACPRTSTPATDTADSPAPASSPSSAAATSTG